MAINSTNTGYSTMPQTESQHPPGSRNANNTPQPKETDPSDEEARKNLLTFLAFILLGLLPLAGFIWLIIDAKGILTADTVWSHLFINAFVLGIVKWMGVALQPGREITGLEEMEWHIWVAVGTMPFGLLMLHLFQQLRWAVN